MNTQNTSQDRPLGYWLKAADRLMAAEFAAAFAESGVTRRDWRMLNIVDGTAEADRPLSDRKLAPLADRGWIARSGAGWELTEEGRTAKERLDAVVDGIRNKAADAVSPDDYDTTLATLRRIAEAYGWEEGAELPRRAGRGHGRGRRGAEREFGHGRGHRGRWHERSEHGQHDERGHGHHRGHGRGDHAGRRDAECAHEHGGFAGRRGFGPRGFGPHGADRLAHAAYAHGFDAGFERGTRTR